MAAYSPPIGFHFMVEFPGISTTQNDHQFQSVSGLSVDLETEEITKSQDSFTNYHKKLNSYLILSLNFYYYLSDRILLANSVLFNYKTTTKIIFGMPITTYRFGFQTGLKIKL